MFHVSTARYLLFIEKLLHKPDFDGRFNLQMTLPLLIPVLYNRKEFDVPATIIYEEGFKLIKVFIGSHAIDFITDVKGHFEAASNAITDGNLVKTIQFQLDKMFN